VLTLDGYPHRGQPIMLTEFGGIAFQAHAEEGVKKIWGYTAVTDARPSRASTNNCWRR
jgi:hypothetical protein